MSRVTKMAKGKMKDNYEKETLRLEETETNFMGGDCYTVDPILKLKMVTASSIFGEPTYYPVGDKKPNKRVTIIKSEEYVGTLFRDRNGTTATQYMEQVIDEALDYDFIETVKWALQMRTFYNMRLNPQIIMVRAALHPTRKIISKKDMDINEDWFRRMNVQVMQRADEPAVQMAYYIYINGGTVSNLPSVLKRSWADKLESLNEYYIAKYKNAELGMSNVVRVCHAHKGNISKLMTNTLDIQDEDKTWNRLKAEGWSWKDILVTISMPHMAKLRNILPIFKEIDDLDVTKSYFSSLKGGVLSGKQFPFRYYTAYKKIEGANDVHHKGFILDELNECIDISIENMPKLPGRTMCLTDNSGSAWGTFTSEYGSVTIAEINNLSSVITAMNSEEGYVGKFGDELKVYEIRKRKGALDQTSEITKMRGKDVGQSTEGGIWEFFNNAIKNKEWWDNIFIYSDQQAGTGGLYGTTKQIVEYEKNGYGWFGTRYINVYKLISEYRKKVNPKVNVYSVQTAGYDNSLVPQYSYRTTILYGWTGKELIFADTMNKLWDEFDERKEISND